MSAALSCACAKTVTISRDVLMDKIQGGWAGQTFGCTYGGPTEFKYNGVIIGDEVTVPWDEENRVKYYFDHEPGLYDDVYMDLSFLKVIDLYGLEAPADSFANAFAHASYNLWHANQAARYNILSGLKAPECGHWLNNPHADDIDFQIEADFAGLISPAMPMAAQTICDKVGHIMNYGDGYYGGLYVAAMYSLAFVRDDIVSVVKDALGIIPRKSDYYKCVSDAIKWSLENPDWKVTWQMVQDKWSEEITCPKGVDDPFDIDAKINSAYVVMGLLYGNGDMDRTLEISMRCGQDSDCNPATAAGILGTLIGYEAIPSRWTAPLAEVLDVPFAHTDISLADSYEMSYRIALDNVSACGGSITDDALVIPVRKIRPAPYEKSFEGMSLITKKKDRYNNFRKPYHLEFESAGIALEGKVNVPKDQKYSSDYVAELEVTIDGRTQTVLMPAAFATRKFDIFWDYTLPSGKHVCDIVWKNPAPQTNVVLESIILYDRK